SGRFPPAQPRLLARATALATTSAARLSASLTGIFPWMAGWKCSEKARMTTKSTPCGDSEWISSEGYFSSCSRFSAKIGHFLVSGSSKTSWRTGVRPSSLTQKSWASRDRYSSMNRQAHSLLALRAGIAPSPSAIGAAQLYFFSGSSASAGLIAMPYFPAITETFGSSKVRLAHDQLKDIAALPAAMTLLFTPPLKVRSVSGKTTPAAHMSRNQVSARTPASEAKAGLPSLSHMRPPAANRRRRKLYQKLSSSQSPVKP